MFPIHRSTLVLTLAASLLGCGESPVSPDAGDRDAGPLDDAALADAGSPPDDDGGPLDSGLPTACVGVRAVALEDDGRTTVTGSTDGRSAPLELGCGIESSPQEILSFIVPGTGAVSVDIYLSGSAGLGDPLFEVRRSCDDGVGALCVTDDSRLADHASGAFLAEGGETLFLVVSGDRASNVGGWTLDIVTATGLEAACADAVDVSITPGEPSVVTVTPHPTIGDTGSIFSSCSPSHLEEALLRVAIPATGRYDLVATTQRLANSRFLDTYLYAQTTCGDPASEVGCADDIADDDTRSTLALEDVTAGATYTIGVELGGGMDEVEVALGLVRVLDAGESCDPDDFWTRCSAGACAGTPSVCPEL